MRHIGMWLGLLAVGVGLLGAVEASGGTILSNVAAFRPVTGSDPYSSSYPLTRGNDEIYGNFSHGKNNDDCWWRVDLEQEYDVAYVEIGSRSGYAARTNGAMLRAYAADGVTQVGPDLVLSGFGNTSPLVVTFDNGGLGWSGAEYFEIGGENLSPAYLHIGEFRAFAEVETYPTFITGVTATSNNVYKDGTNVDVQAQYLVDSRAMTDQAGVLGDPMALHRMLNGALWHSKPVTDATFETPVLTFDLGDRYNLGRMLVWNHNQSGNLARGLKEVLVETSTDGVDYTALADMNGDEQGNVTIPISPGDDAPWQASISLAGITASHVRITALSNHGNDYWGLSEVRFYEIPEPSAWAIVATGVLAVVIWRRWHSISSGGERMRNQTVAWRTLFVVVAVVGMASIASAGALSNVAAFQPVTGSDPYSASYPVSNGNDDVNGTFSHGLNTADCWWRVDLGQARDVASLEVRCRSGYPDRTNWAYVRAYGPDGTTPVGSEFMMLGFDTTTLSQTFDLTGSGWNGVQFIQVGGEGVGVPYMHLAEFRAFAEVETYGGFITGVTATCNNVYKNGTNIDVQPQFVVDSRGMMDQAGTLGDPTALHRSLNGGLWHSKPATDATFETPVLTFDLGGSYDLGRMLVWNHDQSSCLDRGLKEVLIETSTNGVDYAALADGNGGEQGNVTLDISPGGNAGYQTSVLLTGITASYVRLTALSNYGSSYWGLSEVRFYDSTTVFVEPNHPGDANQDGKVDDLDASILAANWQRTGDATWETADFNADGDVNDLDASILAANWQYGVGSAVPEPGAWVLILAGAAALAWRRHRS